MRRNARVAAVKLVTLDFGLARGLWHMTLQLITGCCRLHPCVQGSYGVVCSAVDLYTGEKVVSWTFRHKKLTAALGHMHYACNGSLALLPCNHRDYPSLSSHAPHPTKPCMRTGHQEDHECLRACVRCNAHPARNQAAEIAEASRCVNLIACVPCLLLPVLWYLCCIVFQRGTHRLLATHPAGWLSLQMWWRSSTYACRPARGTSRTSMSCLSSWKPTCTR